MSIPYRTQQNIKRFFIALLVIAVVGAAVWAMWLLWLQRFVVYTRQEGAVLNMELSEKLTPGQAAVPPAEEAGIEIFYNEGDEKVNFSTELAQLKGYYVLGSAVTCDIPDNSVAVGIPAKVIGTFDEFVEKRKNEAMFPNDASTINQQISEELTSWCWDQFTKKRAQSDKKEEYT